MRTVDKHRHGLIRPLPRWTEAGQRRALAEYGIDAPINLADTTEDRVLAPVRAGDVVAIASLHLLADRDLLGTHPRRQLFWWLHHLVIRRAVIVEISTGRRVDTRQISDIPLLLDMAADAIETLTRGTRGRAALEQARAAGKLGGRGRFNTSKNRAAVEALHRDQSVTGDEYLRRLRRLGWSRALAYRELGPRGGR